MIDGWPRSCRRAALPEARKAKHNETKAGEQAEEAPEKGIFKCHSNAFLCLRMQKQVYRYSPFMVELVGLSGL